MEIRKFSRVGVWVLLPKLLSDVQGAFLRAPGLTRRLGVEHCVHLWALGQFKKVQSVHAHLLSCSGFCELCDETNNCGEVDRLREVAPILKISVDELVAKGLLRLL